MLPYAKIKVIAGLGNPGHGLMNTYHNVGAHFLDALLQGNRGIQKLKETKLFSLWQYKREKDTFFILRPHLFMNESGRAVKAGLLARRFPPEALLVAHDDADLPFGTYRLSFNRGAAGHHGVHSVIASLGTKRFWRLRIGIRKYKGRAGTFVLRKMGRGDATILRRLFEEVLGVQRETTKK